MREHTMIVRLRSDEGFTPTRSALRAAIANSLVAWPQGFSLTSICPIPSSRYIKKRRSPTKRDRLPQLPGF